LIIYRGAHVKRGTLGGVSWTLDRERAEWFANRWARRRPYLVEAEVLKLDVRAYFLDRNEAEIIVLPNRLVSHTVKNIPLNRNIEVEKVYWQPSKRSLFTEEEAENEAA
jgi:hypothetical protein